MSDFDTAPIAAIATAPGRGGIGVIRLSGPNLKNLIERLLGQPLTPRMAHYLPFKRFRWHSDRCWSCIIFCIASFIYW